MILTYIELNNISNKWLATAYNVYASGIDELKRFGNYCLLCSMGNHKCPNYIYDGVKKAIRLYNAKDSAWEGKVLRLLQLMHPHPVAALRDYSTGINKLIFVKGQNIVVRPKDILDIPFEVTVKEDKTIEVSVNHQAVRDHLWEHVPQRTQPAFKHHSGFEEVIIDPIDFSKLFILQ